MKTRKARKSISIDANLWNKFESKIKTKQGNKRYVSKGIEEAITLWLEQDKVKASLREINEYLHWIVAIACKLWLDDRKSEAKVLFEATRRISKQLFKLTPNVFGIHIFATAFINPNSDLITSNYPWALIYHTGDKYLARLILHRCSECGSKVCPCLDIQDCDRVEVQDKARGMEDALNILAKLYLSYFFSKRAYDDGIGSRAEISDEYWNIKGELDKNGILIDIGLRDEEKLEKIRRRRSEKHKKFHLELVNTVIKDYKERLPKEVERWRQRFREEWRGLEASSEPFNLMVQYLESLNFTYLTLKRICRKSGRKGRKINSICKDSINLLSSALNQLANCRNAEELKNVLEKLQDVLSLLVKNADKLVKIDIDEGAVAYDNSLAYGIKALVGAITAVEEYLKRSNF